MQSFCDKRVIGEVVKKTTTQRTLLNTSEKISPVGIYLQQLFATLGSRAVHLDAVRFS